MLVLSRKLDEGIQIGPDIRITVVMLKGNQVRLGIEAPDSVTVLRDELLPEGWTMGDPLRERRESGNQGDEAA